MIKIYCEAKMRMETAAMKVKLIAHLEETIERP